jgi:hypothetical protein
MSPCRLSLSALQAKYLEEKNTKIKIKLQNNFKFRDKAKYL